MTNNMPVNGPDSHGDNEQPPATGQTAPEPAQGEPGAALRRAQDTAQTPATDKESLRLSRDWWKKEAELAAENADFYRQRAERAEAALQTERERIAVVLEAAIAGKRTASHYRRCDLELWLERVTCGPM